ncbi:uncharacterized protein F4822DRAFT_94095 [Hypoxylon trugodes]|uniref:uncharacterized protein n=1 Tax=Hypoxylon trugodes TaxID=326681 RepID=UPI0021900B2D|nr:uncharacterized protein F4822DRAFT_94095 [Hypoxylon trugodes]KAI1383151.1 hypothetical protein F4822DRAFT_94095 [Hypoxylon trugodes]
MGRRPNPLILEYFERGEKLKDNSNRYHHRCKACGEDFPKGRIDSLTAHLTKKCPAIPEADRVNALLSLNGYNGDSSGRTNGVSHRAQSQPQHQSQSQSQYDSLIHSSPNPAPSPTPAAVPNLNSLPAPSIDQSQSQIWTPLETLAEVSRQIEANEKHDDPTPTTQEPVSAAVHAVRTTLAAAVPPRTNSNPFELHEQFSLENPPMGFNNTTHRDNEGTDASQKSPELPHSELTHDEERLRQFLQSTSAGSPTQSTLSVAAAATARLNPSLLDPQLLTDEAVPETSHHQNQSTEMMINYPPSPERQHVPATTNGSSTPWDGMTYIPDDIHAPATVNDHGQHLAATLNRGGLRMDTSNGVNGARHRHSRARFDSRRRKEVQEVRRIGACIRCRILRKTCSNSTPCDACKKVLSPRVWHTGCVRTRLSEYIDLYSAGVQAVMAQKRINRCKTTHHLENTGVTVEVSHFPETGPKAVFQVLNGTPKEGDEILPDSLSRVVLLDSNSEDIPTKVEQYMRQALLELIRCEPSHYVRVTLETAVAVAGATNDELLQRSLELWGIVEMMDRERQWTMLAKEPKDDAKGYWVKDDTDSEAYTNICMQLTAAAERKASAASKNLLGSIQRSLQDGKMKLGFPMFLTVMLFLNCMEKTTWAFKAWDEENLRPKWPLEKPPSHFTTQGQGLTELLKMLLNIRHILPKTVPTGPNSPIIADESDLTIQNYFHHLNVTPSYLHTRRDQNNFQPTDSRSLEFLFCAPLLLQ